ncbi:nuclear transport factor 2 family protein [Dyadobacter sp. CY326]|uniref:nuclear transport factor 2 family protein n=1 Tax=Dyadobacter sp. CY326 TaxID=2907300 RepID=UPI001F32EC5B|nr:nuclear transport factor 2 family protein [Dyadobacter sp. CY326]MCE7064468.1 nuclear transport factor 2 family protein [Dyadobacter sp. CY326]
MNRNISVFILLILIASSFKYRTKTREQVLPLNPINLQTVSNIGLQQKASFSDVVAKLQLGNQEFAEGNPSTYKSLWSRTAEVTNFCGMNAQESKGWEAVEKSLDAFNKKIAGNNLYNVEKIASSASAEQGYVLQKEHYILADGTSLNLHVTIVFHREKDGWKIIHRHSDELATAPEPVIAAK